MMAKELAVLEYWADPNAVDLPKKRAEKIDMALEELGVKRLAKTGP